MRCILCLRNHTFSLSSSSLPFQCYSSSPGTSHSNWVASCLSQCLKRSHFHQIHAQLVTSGRLQNPFLASKLLKLSSEFEELCYTLLVFKSINYPDVVCVNTVIKAYSTSSVPRQGVSFYYETIKSGVFPNSFTFPPLIGCSAKVGCARTGEMCHGQAIKNGFNGVMQVNNSLIHMYGCCGLIDSAVDVFDAMLERDLVSWNSIVDGFIKMGDLSTAHKLFDVMPERNVVSWNLMITGYLDGNNPGCVLKLFREMIKTGLSGNDTTAVNVLAACGRSARLKEGASVHGFLIRSLRNLNLIMSTALIDMYSKCQKLEVARYIFDILEDKNLVCWNAMILGHSLHGNPKDGLHLFADMVSETELDCEVELDGNVQLDGRQRLLPDEITYVGVLCACARAGLLAEGRNYFRQMVNLFRIRPNFAHYWCMANLLASNGLVEEALETVRKVNYCAVNVSSESLVWASLLGSCRFQGDSSLAEKVAKALVELEPEDTMCYTLLFNIYAAAGRWEDAAAVKELMKREAGGKMPGCRLLDLIEIVHNFRVADRKQSHTELVTMMAALAKSFSLSNANAENTLMPNSEWQT